MRRRRYNGYHGRVTGRDVFRLMLTLLLIVLVLGGVGLVVGQRYIMYTDEGVRLEIPFFNREEASSDERIASAQVVQLPGPEPEIPVEETQPGPE